MTAVRQHWARIGGESAGVGPPLNYRLAGDDRGSVNVVEAPWGSCGVEGAPTFRKAGERAPEAGAERRKLATGRPCSFSKGKINVMRVVPFITHLPAKLLQRRRWVPNDSYAKSSHALKSAQSPPLDNGKESRSHAQNTISLFTKRSR